ncbi:RNA polymerase sigma factor [Rapidithrix thailandica]|uniref:RNA polymerase sigma factor n=1 Tax=Rapidithrix thailandica TaxID=413964 RepID=A0AAW9S117_9BACT
MSDEAVMTEIKNGDLDKAAILFEKYHVRLFNFFVRLTGERDISHDLTQNLFWRLLKYRQSYHAGKTFKAWMYQIARNVFYDHHQAHKATQNHRTTLEVLKDEVADTVEQMTQKEQEETLTKALQKLPADYREVLVLHKFDGMKYDEIAEILQCSPSAAKVKAHRALKKLRELYFLTENR